jgi:hypothetical protein
MFTDSSHAALNWNDDKFTITSFHHPLPESRVGAFGFFF